jgi:hypothetical protein
MHTVDSRDSSELKVPPAFAETSQAYAESHSEPSMAPYPVPTWVREGTSDPFHKNKPASTSVGARFERGDPPPNSTIKRAEIGATSTSVGHREGLTNSLDDTSDIEDISGLLSSIRLERQKIENEFRHFFPKSSTDRNFQRSLQQDLRSVDQSAARLRNKLNSLHLDQSASRVRKELNSLHLDKLAIEKELRQIASTKGRSSSHSTGTPQPGSRLKNELESLRRNRIEIENELRNIAWMKDQQNEAP